MIKVEKPEIYFSSKILDLSKAKTKLKELKSENKKVGLCHGGFDMLHAGHIKHFELAKRFCDCLCVSITSDKYVSKLKGKSRPVFPDKLRAYSIASVQFVDYVCITDFRLGVEVIKMLKPHYYIKGPDYIGASGPDINAEMDAIKSIGGEIKYTKEPKLSTSEIIKYIKENL